MKKNNKKIEVVDVYNLSDLLALVPFGAEYVYDIVVDFYGHLHDVGTIVTLTPSSNPTGWDTLATDFADVAAHCKNCWDINNNYGYH